MLKPLQLDESALWKKRFQLPIMYGATISKKNPELGVVISNQSCETPQFCQWHVPTGKLKPITNCAGGVYFGSSSPDGKYVYYFEDQKGNELGHFFRVPYEGGDPENITPNLSLYAVRGFHFSHDSSTIAINAIYEKHFHLYCIAVKQDGSLDEPRLIHRTEYETWECMLSYDGKLMAVISTERAKGLRHHSILVFDTQSNERVGELWDGEQNSVMPCMFSPIPDDNRILGITTQTSFERPLVWNPYTNERFEFTLPDMSGDVTPCDWSEDGKRVLLSNMNEAQQQLYIYNLSENCLHVLDHPSGVYDDSNFAGNGEIMTHWQNSITPMQVVMLHEKTGYKTRTLLASGETMPGHALRSITYTSSDGQIVQGWLGVPSGEGPFPTVLEVHGGPHGVVTERFDADAQIWLDHGFAYLSINFRGSTTFGRKFQTMIWGDIGHWELEDMVAARNWLVESGIAKPEAMILTGRSYGGYLTLLGLSKHPDLWVAGIAYVAIADWAMNYEDAIDAMKTAFNAWFKGTPKDKLESYRKSSPVTYAKHVKAPVAIIQGYNDSRTTPRQMEVYVDKLKSLGKDVEIHWYDAGHGVPNIHEMIRLLELQLKFVYRVLQ